MSLLTRRAFWPARARDESKVSALHSQVRRVTEYAAAVAKRYAEVPAAKRANSTAALGAANGGSEDAASLPQDRHVQDRSSSRRSGSRGSVTSPERACAARSAAATDRRWRPAGGVVRRLRCALGRIERRSDRITGIQVTRRALNRPIVYWRRNTTSGSTASRAQCGTIVKDTRL